MAIRISKVNSSALSADKKELVVSSTGKYTGALELRFEVDCLDDLMSALTQAKGSLQTSAAPAAATAPPPPGNAAVSRNPDEIRFEVPKNFTVTADTSGRGLVLFIVNHRLENQAGYALTPDAAKQVAGGLTKSADAILSQVQKGTSQN